MRTQTWKIPNSGLQMHGDRDDFERLLVREGLATKAEAREYVMGPMRAMPNTCPKCIKYMRQNAKHCGFCGGSLPLFIEANKKPTLKTSPIKKLYRLRNCWRSIGAFIMGSVIVTLCKYESITQAQACFFLAMFAGVFGVEIKQTQENATNNEHK